MTIEVLHERGMSNRAIARQLGVHENAVRYRLLRQAAQARDRRADKVSSVAPWAEALALWMRSAEAGGSNGLALYEWLCAEHGYTASYKAVQRFVRAQYARPKIRVRRRIETAPGAQAQADWAEFRGVVVAESPCDLFTFHLVLSHSRHEAIVWSERTDELAWLTVHNAALRRLGGVPGVIRVDNTKTAIAHGAGPWGVVNERYATYARTLRFHVDAARPYTPEDKGKVERRILAHKAGFDPRRRPWRDLGELQTATDAEVQKSAEKRICGRCSSTTTRPVTGVGPLPSSPTTPTAFSGVASRRFAQFVCDPIRRGSTSCSTPTRS